MRSAATKKTMPDPDLSAGTKSKQPTGSSKRKRKQSIKRNIVSDDNSNCYNVIKSSKTEKTCKRVKGEKSGKNSRQISPEKENPETCSLLVTVETEKNSKKFEDSEKKCENLMAQLVASECNSTKLQCQNCKFCSEHIRNKDDAGDLKDKQVRSKKKFSCEICAKGGSSRVYNSVEKHKHHLATVHEIYSEEIKRFECTDCPETVWFPTKSKFTYHLGTKHPGIMRFVCEVCTETFILKANYKNHMKTHNLIVKKKFSCDVCNGTFVNKAGFEAHKKRFPGPHIKQSCVHCGFSFSRETHMKNHRCKTLLLEEAAKANNSQTLEDTNSQDPAQSKSDDLKMTENVQMYIEKKGMIEAPTGMDKKPLNERVIFRKVVPKKNQDQTVRHVQMQTQNVPDSVVVQELREIDLENGTFIAASASEPEPQFIVRDLNGHLIPGNQILQLDINDVQPGEENQVYLADWNIVAPYVIREKSP